VSLVTLDSRVKVNDVVLFHELLGEAALLSLKSGVYFGLDPVGTRIWQLFAEHERLAEITQAIEFYRQTHFLNCAVQLTAFGSAPHGASSFLVF